MAINLEARLVFRGGSALREFDRLEKRMQKIERVIESTGRHADYLSRSMNSAATATRKMSRALDDIAPAARKADRQVERLNRRLRDTKKRTNKLSGLGGVFGVLGQLGLGTLRGLGSLGVPGLSGFSGGFGSGLLGLGSAIFGALKDMIMRIFRSTMMVGTAALGGAAYLSTRGLSIAAENEQALISFETLLGSPEAAKQMISDMYRFAEETPFDIEGVRDSARLLLAYGAPADELLERLRSMGDAVAALGGDTSTMGRVALALGQIESKGKISAQEMNQLAEAGIGAWSILSEELGLSVAELMKLGEQGKLLSKDILPVLYRGMDRKFGGAMKRQSQTLKGMFERMKEVFNNRLLMQWGEGIAQAIRPRLEWITNWFDENEDKTARWGEVLKQTAAQATEWLANEVEKTFNYINDRYINNPEFLELDFVGKVKFIFDDIMRAVDEWLNSGGRDSLQKAADGFGDILGSGLAKITPTLTDMAISMGKSFAQGFLDGLGEGVSNSLRGSALFSWSPGNQAEKTLKGLQSFDEKYGIRSDEFDINNPDYDRLLGGAEASWGEVQSKGWFRDTWDDLRHWTSMKIRGFAGGLSNVPYNGFVARLHKGERVLTAEENKAYTKGGTGGVNITIQHMEVREEADVKKFAVELAREIRQAHAYSGRGLS